MDRTSALAFTDRINRLRKEIYAVEEESRQNAIVLKKWTDWSHRSLQYIQEYMHENGLDSEIDMSLMLQSSSPSPTYEESGVEVFEVSSTEDDSSDDVIVLSSDESQKSENTPPIRQSNSRLAASMSQKPRQTESMRGEAQRNQTSLIDGDFNPQMRSFLNHSRPETRSIPATMANQSTTSNNPPSAAQNNMNKFINPMENVKRVDGGVYVSVEYLNSLSKLQKEMLSRTIQKNMTYRFDHMSME